MTQEAHKSRSNTSGFRRPSTAGHTTGKLQVRWVTPTIHKLEILPSTSPLRSAGQSRMAVVLVMNIQGALLMARHLAHLISMSRPRCQAGSFVSMRSAISVRTQGTQRVSGFPKLYHQQVARLRFVPWHPASAFVLNHSAKPPLLIPSLNGCVLGKMPAQEIYT